MLALSALWPRSFPSRLFFVCLFVLSLFCNWRNSWNLAQFHPLSQHVVQDYDWGPTLDSKEACPRSWPYQSSASLFEFTFAEELTKPFTVFSFFGVFFFGEGRGILYWSVFLKYLSQHISWKKIICQPCCVSMDVCLVAPNHWRLQAQVSLVTSSLEPSQLTGALLKFFLLSSHEAQWSAWSASHRGQKERNLTSMWQLHCAIYTINLSSVHTLCPPELVSLSVLIPLFCLIVADCSKRLWNSNNNNKKRTPYPPFFKNLDSLQATNPPLKLLGKTLQRGWSSFELCVQETVS